MIRNTMAALLIMCSPILGQHAIGGSGPVTLDYPSGPATVTAAVSGQETAQGFTGTVSALGVTVPLPTSSGRNYHGARFYYYEVREGMITFTVTVFLGHPLNPVYTEVRVTDVTNSQNPGSGLVSF